MGHGYRVALAFAFALSAAVQLEAEGHNHKVLVPSSVVKLVAPILEARVDSAQCSTREESFENAERLLGQLFKLQTPAADEALAVLLNFYLGEAPDEDLVHQITKRGRRMLPPLRKYRTSTPVFENRTYPSCLALEHATRRQAFDQTIGAILSGKVIGEE